MISISELSALEQEMTPGEWRLASSGDSHLEEYIIDEHDNDICNTQESARPTGDAAGICAMRNALPALLEIAKAALAWESARKSAAKACARWATGGMGPVRDVTQAEDDAMCVASAQADQHEAACRLAYTAALAKVTP